MARNKGGFGALLLAGAAAFAYYKYSKMSEDEKRDLVGNIKNKGRKMYDEGKRLYEEKVPENVKSAFGRRDTEPTQNGYTHA